MTVRFDGPNTSGLVNRTRGKLCPIRVPSYRMYLSIRKKKPKLGFVSFFFFNSKKKNRWRFKKKIEEDLLLVTLILSAMKILERNSLLHFLFPAASSFHSTFFTAHWMYSTSEQRQTESFAFLNAAFRNVPEFLVFLNRTRVFSFTDN